MLALSITLLAVLNADAAKKPQTEKLAKNSRNSPVRKTRSLSNPEISEARDLLFELGYWINPDVSGKDISLRHALIAFQKIEGRNRTGVLSAEELEALRCAKRPEVLEHGYPHIEIDLQRQVLFIVDAPECDLRILPISSGSGEFFTEGGETRQALTPTGRFNIYRKVEGWRKSQLGLLYYPNYIYYGIAIHGNPSVPATPASHGCIRIPMFASQGFSKIATIGMEVIVYDGDPLE